MYGHKWTSSQGDEPNDSWVDGLSDVTPEQLNAGYKALMKRTDEWPPMLVEFKNLCSGYDPEAWRHRAERQNNEVLAVERNSHKTDAAQASGFDFFKKQRKEGFIK